jgi:DNA-binding NarL/FixJ family response regulator
VRTVFPHIILKKRQVNVLLYSSNGYTNKEIAAKMNTTEKAVQGIRQTIMKKFGARIWPQAIADAFRMNYID